MLKHLSGPDSGSTLDLLMAVPEISMIIEQTEIRASKNRTNPSLKLHPRLPLTTATDAPARSLTCGKQAPQLSNWHESHESEMWFLWKHGARGLGAGGTWKRGVDHRRPMKLRSGKRQEEQVGGGRIAEGAVEVRIARASPVAVAVAGAKTAPCECVSVPIL